MKESKKSSTRDPMLISLKKLQQNIQKSEQKNLSTFSQIQLICPTFEYPLYRPSLPSFSWENREELSVAEKIMLREIDRLMEDQQKLSIEMSRQSQKAREYERKLEKQVMSGMDHFTFLRKIWKKQAEYVTQEQKVDKLIHNVGAIKGHILNLIKRQGAQTQSSPQLHQQIINSPQYCHLVKQNEMLRQHIGSLQLPVLQDNYNIYTPNFSTVSSGGGVELAKFTKRIQELENIITHLRRELEEKNKVMGLLKDQVQGKINKSTEASKAADIFMEIQGADGSYHIFINKIDNQVKQANCADLSKTALETGTLKSKRSLQQILRFIESSTEVRPSRTSFKPQQNPQQPQQQGRKYTVQQITKPKFISSRQITQPQMAPQQCSTSSINNPSNTPTTGGSTINSSSSINTN